MANHPDQLKTWVLKVYIHCEGCKKKVYKILQNIDGVYKTVIDSQQHKAIVTGSVTGDTLVQKLLKSGKHAEILPESFEPEKPKSKKQNNKNKADDEDPEPPFLEEKEAEPKDLAPTHDENDGETEDKIIVPIAAGGDGEDENKDKDNAPPSGKNKKKNKKKKKDNNNDDDNNVSPKGETESQTDNNPPLDDESVTTNGDESKEQSHFVAPSDQMVYATPPAAAPYFGYYPTPAYGMSYNTSYPSSEASYYTPPVYGYAQSHPSAAYYNPPPMMPPPAYYRRSAFDDDDQEDAGEGYCTIM